MYSITRHGRHFPHTCKVYGGKQFSPDNASRVPAPSGDPALPASESEAEDAPALLGERGDSADQNRLDSNNALHHLSLLVPGFPPVDTAESGADPQPSEQQQSASPPAQGRRLLFLRMPSWLRSQPVAVIPAADGDRARKRAASTPAATSVVAVEDGAPGSSQSTESPDGRAVGITGQELPEQEQREVQELKARDREVRQHEQAHMAAAGGHARGGASYEYTTGPDNRRPSIGGEVSIDTSKVLDNPEGTIRKAQVIYRAALVPAEPSPQDPQRGLGGQADGG